MFNPRQEPPRRRPRATPRKTTGSRPGGGESRACVAPHTAPAAGSGGAAAAHGAPRARDPPRPHRDPSAQSPRLPRPRGDTDPRIQTLTRTAGRTGAMGQGPHGCGPHGCGPHGCRLRGLRAGGSACPGRGPAHLGAAALRRRRRWHPRPRGERARRAPGVTPNGLFISLSSPKPGEFCDLT